MLEILSTLKDKYYIVTGCPAYGKRFINEVLVKVKKTPFILPLNIQEMNVEFKHYNLKRVHAKSHIF